MSDNTFMEDDAVAGYGIVQMVAQAVEEAGDDPAAIAEYLHGQTFDLPGYPFEVSWTEWASSPPPSPVQRSAKARRPKGSTRPASGTPRR